jgi:hypothetical protein
VGLERGTLSLVSITEELLGRNISGSGLESREYGHRESSHWPRGTLYPQKFALASLTSGGSSVGKFACGLRPRTFYNYFPAETLKSGDNRCQRHTSTENFQTRWWMSSFKWTSGCNFIVHISILTSVRKKILNSDVTVSVECAFPLTDN